MRLVLDGKSLAVGLFAGAALVAGLGAAQDDPPEAGRYGIAANQLGVYAIDTATREVGRIKTPPGQAIPAVSAGPVER